MALLFTADKFIYGLGIDFKNAYIRIIPICYNFFTEMWEFKLKIYFNKETREFERLSEYFCKKLGFPNEVPNPLRPEGISDESWEKILKFRIYVGDIRPLDFMNRGLAKSVVKTLSIDDKDSLVKEAYEHIKTYYPGSINCLDDLTIEELLAKYIPDYKIE